MESQIIFQAKSQAKIASLEPCSMSKRVSPTSNPAATTLPFSSWPNSQVTTSSLCRTSALWRAEYSNEAAAFVPDDRAQRRDLHSKVRDDFDRHSALTLQRWDIMTRDERKSQVLKCMGFCSADSSAKKDKKSALQKLKH